MGNINIQKQKNCVRLCSSNETPCKCFVSLIESSLQIMWSAYIEFICQVTRHRVIFVENIHV